LGYEKRKLHEAGAKQNGYQKLYQGCIWMVEGLVKKL
jgi:hypothetical protein